MYHKLTHITDQLVYTYPQTTYHDKYHIYHFSHYLKPIRIHYTIPNMYAHHLGFHLNVYNTSTPIFAVLHAKVYIQTLHTSNNLAAYYLLVAIHVLEAVNVRLVISQSSP